MYSKHFFSLKQKNWLGDHIEYCSKSISLVSIQSMLEKRGRRGRPLKTSTT